MNYKANMKNFLPLLYFVLTSLVLLLFLMLCAKIPRSLIRERMLYSARYLCENRLFYEALEGVSSSKIDRYADSILLGISWQYDPDNSLKSVLESSYYYVSYQNENKNLLDAVRKNISANKQYLRYWHGSAGVVKILMTFLTLPQIYLFNGLFMLLLILSLIIRLALKREWLLMTGLSVGLIGSSVWFVPLSLEYTWVFLIMLIELHAVIFSFFPEDLNTRCNFFMMFGMITSYFDFLTCETLTLTVPLLFLIHLDKKAASWKAIFKICFFWAAGYLGMFIFKWILSAIVLRENILPYVVNHVGERIAGNTGASFISSLIEAPLRNILNLFPVNYGSAGFYSGISLFLVYILACIVYHRKNFDRTLIKKYIAAGMIPYVRYIVLVNHSYLHTLFTFRAQAAALFAAILILGEMIFNE